MAKIAGTPQAKISKKGMSVLGDYKKPQKTKIKRIQEVDWKLASMTQLQLDKTVADFQKEELPSSLPKLRNSLKKKQVTNNKVA